MQLINGIDTIPSFFHYTAGRLAKNIATSESGAAQTIDTTFGQLATEVKYLASALSKQGFKHGDRIAFVGRNSKKWLLLDYACASLSLISVPIYRTLDLDTFKLIIKDAMPKALFIDFDDVDSAKYKDAVSNKVDVFGFSKNSADLASIDDFIEAGKSMGPFETYFRRVSEISETDLYTIIYTSGTLGEPKGVMLSHKNFVSNIKQSQKVLPLEMGSEIYLSYLPVAHSLERHCQAVLLLGGNRIVFGRGMDRLGDDFVDFAPSVVIAVPRVLEKVVNKVKARVEEKGKVGQWLFKVALDQRDKKSLSAVITDKLVLKKIRERFGQRLKYIVSGGGPLSSELNEFFEAVGITVLQGYGLTETSPVIACNVPKKNRIGSVGQVYANLEVKISDASELLVKGPSVMQGYYKKKQATADVFDELGFLHTGDLARFDEDGFLYIEGRLKEILALTNGKKVAPAKLEGLLVQFSWIDQVCVVGDAQSFVSALIVCSLEGLRTLFPEWQNSALAEIVLREKVWGLAEKEIALFNENISRFERIKRFALLPEPFSEKAGLLTPTQKIRRRRISETYADVIHDLYGDTAHVFEQKIPLLPNPF